MRFDPSIVTVKQSSIVSQSVSSPVLLSLLPNLDRDPRNSTRGRGSHTFDKVNG